MTRARSSIGETFALVTFLASTLAWTGAHASAADEAAIREAGTVRDEALRTLDANRFASVFAEDGILMAETTPTVEGKTSIRDFMMIYLRLMTQSNYTPKVADVGLEVSGDLAVRWGTYTVTDPQGEVQDSGKWLESWRRAGGKWKLQRDIWNSDMLPLFAPMAFTEQGWVNPKLKQPAPMTTPIPAQPEAPAPATPATPTPEATRP